MTRTARIWLWAAIAILAVLGAAAAGLVSVLRSQSPPGIPASMVPATWAQYRTSRGHTVHVERGKAQCIDCHAYETNGFKNPGTAPCLRCHDKEAKHAHPGGTEKPTDCLTCHIFAPDQPAPKCISCHSNVQGHLASIKVHATVECAECHRIHQTPSILAKECTSCHRERAQSHAQHTDSKGCVDCHQPHAPASAALTICSSCHERPAGPKPANHDSCLGCHRPHKFTADGSNTCRGCHGLKPTLLATQVRMHASCTSCHEPHAPTLAAQSCAGCHADVRLAHDGRTDCIGCHAPHSGDVNAKVAACTACHQKVGPTDTSVHAGNVACVNCHKPHDFSRPDRRALCIQCHGREVSLTATSKGHSDCTACHGPSAHQPSTIPVCGTCHARELTSAPPGHQRCLQCHEPHSGQGTAFAPCASCHRDRLGGPHDTIPGRCESCHRPHGPGGHASPPPCSSCHAREQLPALHAVPAHGDCLRCHTSHAPPHADRATCTGECHTDRRNHQPQAAACNGCHVFRR